MSATAELLNNLHDMSETVHPLESVAHQPLPCEDIFEQDPLVDHAFFDALREATGKPVRRIPPASLRATRPVQMRAVESVSLPVFHMLDPFASASRSELMDLCRLHRDKVKNGCVRTPNTEDLEHARSGKFADRHLLDRGVLAMMICAEGAQAMNGQLWLHQDRVVGAPVTTEAAERSAYRVTFAAKCVAMVALIAAACSLPGSWVVAACFMGVLALYVGWLLIVQKIDGVTVHRHDVGWNLLYMACRLPGRIPPQARERIMQAQELAKRVGGEVRLIVEADWHVLREASVELPEGKDPLIVIVRGTDVAYVDRFDCTALETRLAQEHAVVQ